MKKLAYLAALLVVAATSFAFLPKAEEPAGCMMVTGYTEPKGLSSVVGYIVVVGPDGQTVRKDEVPIKALSQSALELRTAQLPRLTELQRQGWVIKHIDQGSIYLEKP